MIQKKLLAHKHKNKLKLDQIKILREYKKLFFVLEVSKYYVLKNYIQKLMEVICLIVYC